MTPTAIFEAYNAFQEVLAGNKIPQEIQLGMAREFLHTLPPVQFSMGCPVTRKWLSDALQEKINELQKLDDERNRKPSAAEDGNKKGKKKEAS